MRGSGNILVNNWLLLGALESPTRAGVAFSNWSNGTNTLKTCMIQYRGIEADKRGVNHGGGGFPVTRSVKHFGDDW